MHCPILGAVAPSIHLSLLSMSKPGSLTCRAVTKAAMSRSWCLAASKKARDRRSGISCQILPSSSHPASCISGQNENNKEPGRVPSHAVDMSQRPARLATGPQGFLGSYPVDTPFFPSSHPKFCKLCHPLQAGINKLRLGTLPGTAAEAQSFVILLSL